MTKSQGLVQRFGYVLKQLPMLALAGFGYIVVMGGALNRLLDLPQWLGMLVLVTGALAVGLYSRWTNPPPWAEKTEQEGE